MKKSYNLYLVLSLSFLVIIFISFFVGIKSEIIFGYSVATLIFAVIDFMIVVQEGKARVTSLKNEDINIAIDEYMGEIDVVVEDTIGNLRDGKKELANTRKKFYEKILAQQPIFNLRKKNVKKAMKPAENISELNSDLKFADSLFDKIKEHLQSLDPEKVGKKVSKIVWLFSMVGLILVLVSPFIPEQAYIYIFGESFSSIGTYLVLLSLSLIFLTNFFRNKYEEQALEIQKSKYYSMVSQLEKIKFQMDFSMKDLREALDDSSEEFGEVLNLIASSFEKVVETKEDKK